LASQKLRIRDEAARLEASLIEFYKAAWPTFDPAPYTHGWHLEAIAEHLEAVTYGKIRRLLITMPPRHSKTLLASVAWPSWIWTQERDDAHPLVGPQVKLLCLSYGDDLALDSALLMRRLVESDWYQERWGRRVQIRSDQEAKSKFDTDAGGTRISASFGGTLTGRGGDIKIIDDPLKADDAESDAKRDAVIRRYDGTLKSRVTDPRHTAEVMIMQRLHQNDLAGHVLAERDPELKHLNLPAEYEPARTTVTSIGWSDPRKKDGDILWPERFGPKQLAPFKRSAYEWAGQWQQRPEVRGGAIINREWWHAWEHPENKFPECSYIVASLDPAYTEKQENDPSGFTVWGVFQTRDNQNKIILMDAWRKRLALHGPDQPRLANETTAAYAKRTSPKWGLCEWVAHSCRRFKVHRLLIENKASGIPVAQELRRLYFDDAFGVQLVDPKGLDKVARAYAVQTLFTDNLIFAPDREWARMVIDEAAVFPRGTHDDLVDSMTQALKHLREIGLAVRHEEQRSMNAHEMMFKSEPKPLYPA